MFAHSGLLQGETLQVHAYQDMIISSKNRRLHTATLQVHAYQDMIISSKNRIWHTAALQVHAYQDTSWPKVAHCPAVQHCKCMCSKTPCPIFQEQLISQNKVASQEQRILRTTALQEYAFQDTVTNTSRTAHFAEQICSSRTAYFAQNITVSVCVPRLTPCPRFPEQLFFFLLLFFRKTTTNETKQKPLQV